MGGEGRGGGVVGGGAGGIGAASDLEAYDLADGFGVRTDHVGVIFHSHVRMNAKGKEKMEQTSEKKGWWLRGAALRKGKGGMWRVDAYLRT